MNTHKLIITWKPSLDQATKHSGSFKRNIEVDGVVHPFLFVDFRGLTARSERESFSNIKSRKAAEGIVARRNKKNILLAKWGNKVIFSDSVDNN